MTRLHRLQPLLRRNLVPLRYALSLHMHVLLLLHRHLVPGASGPPAIVIRLDIKLVEAGERDGTGLSLAMRVDGDHTLSHPRRSRSHLYVARCMDPIGLSGLSGRRDDMLNVIRRRARVRRFGVRH